MRLPTTRAGSTCSATTATKEVGKGTGQGLALAYNCIVKRHKGSIHFETELGTGTTFVIRLPLEAETQKTGAPP